MLGKTEGKRWQKMRWLDSFTNSMDRNLSKFQDRGTWCDAVHGVSKETHLSN